MNVVRHLYWRHVRHWDGELCQFCARKYYPMLWHADASLWAKVMPSTHGLVCPRCFNSMLLAAGEPVIWFPLSEGEALARW